MPARKRRRAASPWFGFALDAAQLGLEAHHVIGLRLARLAAGGLAAGTEAERMVAEKGTAFIAAHAAAAASIFAGRADLAPAEALSVYRRAVRANRRRLSRG